MSEWFKNSVECDKIFSPGDKIRVCSVEEIDRRVDRDGRTYTTDKWAGCVLTVQNQVGHCISVKETDITFADFIVESAGFLPDNLFEM